MEKTKLLRIEENSVFFEFIENMLKYGKKTGVAKMKDGSIKTFEYVGHLTNSVKTHYIRIKE